MGLNVSAGDAPGPAVSFTAETLPDRTAVGSAEAAEGEADGPATAWLPRAVIFAQKQEGLLQTRELTAKSPWTGSGSTHTLAHVRPGTCVQGAPGSTSHTRTHVNVHPACAPTCDMRVPARARVNTCAPCTHTHAASCPGAGEDFLSCFPENPGAHAADTSVWVHTGRTSQTCRLSLEAIAPQWRF